METTINRAAVVIIKRMDGRYLCVWNKRYGGWSFLGGKVEDGETPMQAVCREAMEEADIQLLDPVPIFEGPHGMKVETSRGSIVHVFGVRYFVGIPHEVETGCPVTWLTYDEFMQWSPFAEFYKKVFAQIDGRYNEWP